MDATDRLAQVRARIAMACARAGRDVKDVRLVGVTKYVGLEQVQALWNAGLSDFGENRLENSADKLRDLPSAEWHFIGQLQSRKIPAIVASFAMIHSLDRLSIAKKIDVAAQSIGIRMPCLIQVNVSGEPSKGGLALCEMESFLRQVTELQGISIIGLMTMAPAVADPEAARPVFRKLSELRAHMEQLAVARIDMRHLSMGMSNDFEIAIEEGATMVRLGSVLVK